MSFAREEFRMGWSGGSSLLRDVWARVRFYVPESDRELVLAVLMNQFAGRDCDTLAEVVCDDWPESGPAYRRYRLARGATEEELAEEDGE